MSTMKVSKRALEFLGNLFFLVVLGWFFVEAIQYSERARMIPLIISGMGIVFIVVEMIIRYVARNDVELGIDAAVVLGADKKEDEFRAQSEAKDAGVDQKPGGKIYEIVLWSIAIVAMLWFIGFQITAFAYPIIYLIFGNTKMTWWKAFLVGFFTWLSIYLLFSVLLNMPFFPGIFFGGEL
jgi:hypothetical protein